MLSRSLPEKAEQLLQWDWEDFAPLYQELNQRPVTIENIDLWLADWSRLSSAATELFARLYYAVTADTTDRQAEERFTSFTETFYPNWIEAENRLKQQLLASGQEPANFQIILKNMRAQADLFREENLPLLSEEQRLSSEYDRIMGVQTVSWFGKELTIPQLQIILYENNREMRERAWRAAAQRQLQDRQAINHLWQKLLDVRSRIAENAGKPDYRAYRWQDYLRFDYTPDDTLSFHQAILEVVVPVANRIYDRRKQRLGVDSLRPWDLDIDPLQRPPLRPFSDIEDLKQRVSAVFHALHPDLGGYFDTLVRENMLDLENRMGKGPGAYCNDYPLTGRPIIFANAVGLHEDVMTMLHESGHAFHVFESLAQPYLMQRLPGAEFAEVASMGMELLASPYLDIEPGGFYSTADANRARVQHLEGAVLFWPYMSVVDLFQHWVYTHMDQANEPAACDETWSRLWQQFIPGVDWTGLEDEMATGWQRKQHIHTTPFYYVEYGLAQLGAAQIWRRSLKDPSGAVSAYRRALALGGTVPLPQLFETAGAKLAFDAETLGAAVEDMERTIYQLDPLNPAQPA